MKNVFMAMAASLRESACSWYESMSDTYRAEERATILMAVQVTTKIQWFR